MIISVDVTNLLQAATIHSISWKESHRAFCMPDFVASHTPDRQRNYLSNKMNSGTKIYMLVEEKPIGIVSVTNSLIEDLYVLPDMQNMGYGTKLLQYAIDQCTDTPTLWILENNINAERLYQRMGFMRTGRRNSIASGLDEIEFALTHSHKFRFSEQTVWFHFSCYGFIFG
ncbi:MAG: GNAT family N-acetyltransferase [Candidatus Faecousia sp.]|nr:GNAT family N-acetyltransferase [Candidatus Faecousia sp.]